MKHGSVVVGYLDDGHWSASFGLSYRDMVLFDASTSRHVVRQGGTELRQMCGTGGIAEGRNEVARGFLDGTDGEWLWFVDTDMGFTPDTVDRLLASADRRTAPVMGGLCFALKRTDPGGVLHAPTFAIIPTAYAYAETGDEVGFIPLRDYGRDQVITVAATGAACMLIHRDVLARVRAEYGDAWFDPITHPAGYKGGRRVFSEDLSFCVRLAAVGIPVHVDTSVKTSHEKGGLYLTEDAFDKQMALARLEGEVARDGDRGPVRDAVDA